MKKSQKALVLVLILTGAQVSPHARAQYNSLMPPDGIDWDMTGWLLGGAAVIFSACMAASGMEQTPENQGISSGSTAAFSNGFESSTGDGKIRRHYDQDVNRIVRKEAEKYIMMDSKMKSRILELAIIAVRSDLKVELLSEQDIVLGITKNRYQFQIKNAPQN